MKLHDSEISAGLLNWSAFKWRLNKGRDEYVSERSK